MKLIEQISKNCEWHKTVNDSFIAECENRIEKLQNLLPSGSGIDSGCKIDIENSGRNKVVITFDYHHMNEDGYYVGWTNHKLIVVPSFVFDFEMRITGKDKNDTKEYLYDLFDTVLREKTEL
jgi:hypothetical protein